MVALNDQLSSFTEELDSLLLFPAEAHAAGAGASASDAVDEAITAYAHK